MPNIRDGADVWAAADAIGVVAAAGGVGGCRWEGGANDYLVDRGRVSVGGGGASVYVRGGWGEV